MSNAANQSVSHTTCPLCGRGVKVRVLKDGTRLIPGHGHRIMRGMHTGGMQCRTSGFSLEGLEILKVWTSAFGLLKDLA